MAHLYKRGKTWWIKYHIDGKQQFKSLKTTNKAIAVREKQAFEAVLLEPNRMAPQEKNPQCDEFWKRYLEWAKDHKRPNTITVETHHWNQLLECTKAGRLGDINEKEIEAFKKWKKQKGAAPQSINNALKDIRTVYNKAKKLGFYTGPNPAVNVERYKITRKLPEFHTEEELNKLLESAKAKGFQTEAMVLLGAMAGMRKNEMLAARWDWFDFEERVIRIKKYDGFDIKDHEERVIPMHSAIYDALKPQKKESGYVFESDRQSNGKNRYRCEPKKSLITALKTAGLTTARPFQRLRETFACLRAQKGTSIFKLSKWLGHSSVRTTERHYASLAEGYDADIE